MQTPQCPQCGGSDVRDGKVLGYSETACHASVFRPDSTAKLTVSAGVAIRPEFRACVQCGLLWQTLTPPARKELDTFDRDNALL